MNKKEMIDKVALDLEVTKKEAALAVKSVIDVITDELNSGGKVSLVGFGTFETVLRASRKCRNLQTEEIMTVPAKMAPKFRPSQALKDSVSILPAV